MHRINSIQALQTAVTDSSAVTVYAGRSKSALKWEKSGVTALDLSGLSGILEYEPSEYTITALAGTPITTVNAALAEHGQYLPFDPPFAERGATLGGTVATALSGSGRYRFGGVRDFLSGVRFVDGQGRHVRGGGKVVKNAAGFDLPKLMVGSLGQFGLLTEVSFKVFPRPEAYQTLVAPFRNLQDALAALQSVVDSHFDIHALDLHVQHEDGQRPTYALWIRLGGLSAVLPQRMAQLRQLVNGGETFLNGEEEGGEDEGGEEEGREEEGEEEERRWITVQEATWMPAESTLVKVALTAGKIGTVESILTPYNAPRHYAVGGNLAWIGWSAPLDLLDQQLQQNNLTGLTLIGTTDKIYLGKINGRQFAQRIKQALDPANRLPSYL